MGHSIGQFWVIETLWGVRDDGIYYSREAAQSAVKDPLEETVRLVDFIVIRSN